MDDWGLKKGEALGREGGDGLPILRPQLAGGVFPISFVPIDRKESAPRPAHSTEEWMSPRQRLEPLLDRRMLSEHRRLEVITTHSSYVAPPAEQVMAHHHRAPAGALAPDLIDPSVCFPGIHADPRGQQEDRPTRKWGQFEHSLAMAPGERELGLAEEEWYVCAESVDHVEQLTVRHPVFRQSIDGAECSRSVAGASTETSADRNFLC